MHAVYQGCPCIDKIDLYDLHIGTQDPQNRRRPVFFKLGETTWRLLHQYPIDGQWHERWQTEMSGSGLSAGSVGDSPQMSDSSSDSKDEDPPPPTAGKKLMTAPKRPLASSEDENIESASSPDESEAYSPAASDDESDEDAALATYVSRLDAAPSLPVSSLQSSAAWIHVLDPGLLFQCIARLRAR